MGTAIQADPLVMPLEPFVNDDYGVTFQNERVISVTPTQAEYLLKHLAWESQRPLRPGHVGILAEAMRRGEFFPTPLLVGIMNNQRKRDPKLLDGQHRLHAIIESQKSYDFPIVHYVFDSELDRERAYREIDRGASRTWTDTNSSFRGIANLNAKQGVKLQAAIKLLNSLQLQKRQESNYIRRSHDFAAQEMPRWAPIMSDYCQMVSGSPLDTTHWAMRMIIVSQAITTLDAFPDLATSYWRAFLELDETPANSGPRIYQRWVVMNPEKGHTSAFLEAMRRFASSWNAWQDCRLLGKLYAAKSSRLDKTGDALLWFTGE